MKHKRLLTMVFALFAAIPMAFAFAACDDSSKIDPKPPITSEQDDQGSQGNQDEQDNQGSQGNQDEQDSSQGSQGNQGEQGNQGSQGGNQEHEHSGETWGHDETSHWKVCDECGEAISAKETHSGEKWVYDETSHWKVCDECGERFSKEAHNLQKDACLVCDYSEKFTEG